MFGCKLLKHSQKVFFLSCVQFELIKLLFDGFLFFDFFLLESLGVELKWLLGSTIFNK